MNNFYLDIVLNYSILIPAIIGIIRWHSLAKSYYPFLLFLWIGLLNETLSLILITHSKGNTVNSNIYVLIEYIIVLYQFYLWKGKGILLFTIASALGIIVWVVDNLLLHSLFRDNSIFRSTYSFIILLYSIDRINELILLEKKSLRRNAGFVICLAFVLFYGCKTVLEAFNIFEEAIQDLFYQYLFLILSIINCISNVLYTLAILWNPKKQLFIKRF